MPRKGIDDVLEKFDILISLLHEIRNTKGDADGRGLSVAITHTETARLWFQDAVKGVEA